MNKEQNNRSIEFIKLGLMEYGACHTLQYDTHNEVLTKKRNSVVFLVEHPNVVTFGKHGNEEFLLADEKRLKEAGISVYKTERGGQVTVHLPGQLVVYPILDLRKLRLTPKTYINLLCKAVIELLSLYGICGAQSIEYPGVWVATEKICAVGVRIKERITMHGIALNINNDLSFYSLIVPCGISGRGVTTMSQLLKKRVDFNEVEDQFISIFKSLILPQ